MLQYDESKIRACLVVLEDIKVRGTDNMLKLLFLKETLQNPVKEDTKDGSHRRKQEKPERDL